MQRKTKFGTNLFFVLGQDCLLADQLNILYSRKKRNSGHTHAPLFCVNRRHHPRLAQTAHTLREMRHRFCFI